MDKKTVDRYFMLILAIVGALLFLMCTYCFSNLVPDACGNSTLNEGLTAVMVIGAICVTLAISYMMCNKGHDCYGDEYGIQSARESREVYLGAGAVLSIGFIISLASVLGSLKDVCIGEQPGATQKQINNGKTLKFLIWFMLVICIILLLVCGLGFYMVAYVPEPEAIAIANQSEAIEKSEQEIKELRKKEKLAESKKRELLQLKNNQFEKDGFEITRGPSRHPYFPGSTMANRWS